MEFDFQWLLIGLPVAFALGWAASRLDLRQLRRDVRDSPRAYFKGLNLLLNEQHDKAIDAFIEAVQHDPETAELHFALGNLFRRRGEFERAVRVHQHLLARGDLKAADRERAQHALAQDFMTAGLFDRAEAAWAALEGTSFEPQARLAQLTLAERSRDWTRAIEVANRLDPASGGAFAARIAHYECERAQQADAAGRSDEAEAALARARHVAPAAARPLLLIGQRRLQAGRAAEAMRAWDEMREQQPAAFLLVAEDYARAAMASGREGSARVALSTLLETLPAAELLRALELLDPPGSASLQRWVEHLAQHPTLAGAERLLGEAPERWGPQGAEALRAAVARAARPLHRYRCAACGFEAQHYFWQCPGCQSWDSYPAQRIDAS